MVSTTGSCESYELQVLLLIELRFFPLDRRALHEAYEAFFRPRFPQIGNRYLSGMRTLLVTALSEQLGAFRNHLELRETAGNGDLM